MEPTPLSQMIAYSVAIGLFFVGASVIVLRYILGIYKEPKVAKKVAVEHKSKN